MPEPDPDRDRLLAAAERAGLEAAWVSWDDPGVAWQSFDLLVLRATWNYFERRDAFLAWAAARGPALLNPLPILRWNSHKSYLHDLEREGVAVVPTELVPRGSEGALGPLLARRGWSQVVIKPVVSAGSFSTRRFGPGELTEAERFLADTSKLREMMVQPYVSSVEAYGERSLIWIDGLFTHAIRKTPRFSGDAEQVSEALPIADDERAVAQRALSPRAQQLLYARVDLARDDQGAPMVMELELIEPSLFLAQHPPAEERLVQAIVARLRAPSGGC
jgi:hypothetical protein